MNSLQPLPNLTLIKDGKNINPAILLILVKQSSISDMFAENNVNPENNQSFDFVFLLLTRDSLSKLGSPLAPSSVDLYH